MFSHQQKREIAMKVQAILQETAHDELPAGEVSFILHVDGAEDWSWANIRNSSARDVPVPDVLVQNMSASNTARTQTSGGRA
jgi:hypothetical protein